MTLKSPIPGDAGAPDRDHLLVRIQDRVLWLSTYMVHYANKVRPNPDGTKVGGHQASSASAVTILTSLFFDYMRPGDRIAVKPHASPVLHAIQYLLGSLDHQYLTSFRAFHGLQAYPSRTKDPDPVDFSTGSVGLGAVAPNFAALTEKYLERLGADQPQPPHRYIALIGDAELDEGSVWESIVEPHLQGLPTVLWVVDLNRQSLDRVIPGIRVQLWRQMFRANGWGVVDAKYGSRMEAAFREPDGELLRACIDDMPNEVYQRLVRLPTESLRDILPSFSRFPSGLRRLISQWSGGELLDILLNLGGHDFGVLRRAFAEAEAERRPCVLFAYTLKGWRLPIVGDPQNHSVVLSTEDMSRLRLELGIDEGHEWEPFSPSSAEGQFCRRTGERLRLAPQQRGSPPDVPIPTQLGRAFTGIMSTQQAFGLLLSDIARELPALARRIVTVSPDVASSTNLGGWINRVGVWGPTEKAVPVEDPTARPLRWIESPGGQHIELGISEGNLFLLLGQLGLTYERSGELLFPIGTLYDPFVCRALEAFIYGCYSEARFMVVGTPAGVTLSREGGAHQSVLTPSIGVGMPNLTYYEPCFAQELEWILFSALEDIRLRRDSTYLRLTTKPIDQALFRIPEEADLRETLRRQVLDGAYRLVDLGSEASYRPGENVVNIFATGAMVPEAIEASHQLKQEGVFANVINVTSPSRLYRNYQESVLARLRVGSTSGPLLGNLLRADEARAPVVTVIDGHPLALVWVGSALGVKACPLGVTQFGQSGSRDELYREYQIGTESIVAASLAALEEIGA